MNITAGLFSNQHFSYIFERAICMSFSAFNLFLALVLTEKVLKILICTGRLWQMGLKLGKLAW
jgi:hypothetical protein